jgi:hypothetical protein
MLETAPVFVDAVQAGIDNTLVVVAVVIEAFAFINCLIQRSDAFGAIGTLSKGAWLALTAASLLVTLLLQVPSGGIGLLGFIAITIAAIYLLDVRPALRDASDGSNPW